MFRSFWSKLLRQKESSHWIDLRLLYGSEDSLLKLVLISWPEWYIFKSKYCSVPFLFIGVFCDGRIPVKMLQQGSNFSSSDQKGCKSTISNSHLVPNMADSELNGEESLWSRKWRDFYGNICCTGKKGQVQTLFAATEIPLYILLHLVFTRSGLKYETMELCGLQSYVQNFNRRLRNVFLPF